MGRGSQPSLTSPPLPFPPSLPRAAAHRAPAWTPQEEQALRELYWKYKEVEGTGGVRGATGPSPGGGSVPAASPLPRPGRHRCHPGRAAGARADAEAGGEAFGEAGAGQQRQGLPAAEVSRAPQGRGQHPTRGASTQGCAPPPPPPGRAPASCCGRRSRSRSWSGSLRSSGARTVSEEGDSGVGWGGPVRSGPC